MDASCFLISSLRPLRTFSKETAPELTQIELALRNCLMRHAIIELLSNEGNLANKARFCAAVLDYEHAQLKKEKLSKARKIASTFLDHGSRLSVPINEEIREQILEHDHKKLSAMKKTFLQELEDCDRLQENLPCIWSMVYACQEDTDI